LAIPNQQTTAAIDKKLDVDFPFVPSHANGQKQSPARASSTSTLLHGRRGVYFSVL
jgi:hypothetical protein